MQETQLSLTNRATHLCKWNDAADFRRKRPSPYVLPCRIWSFRVKWCWHKYRRTPEIGELWNSSLLGWEAWLAARYTPSPHVLQVFTTSNFVVWQQKVYA